MSSRMALPVFAFPHSCLWRTGRPVPTARVRKLMLGESEVSLATITLARRIQLKELICPPRTPFAPLSRNEHARTSISTARDRRAHSKCRTHLKNAADKRKGFAEVEDNFHPAFRFFFLENFPEPFAWYNSRLTFTRYLRSLLFHVIFFSWALQTGASVSVGRGINRSVYTRNQSAKPRRIVSLPRHPLCAAVPLFCTFCHMSTPRKGAVYRSTSPPIYAPVHASSPISPTYPSRDDECHGSLPRTPLTTLSTTSELPGARR